MSVLSTNTVELVARHEQDTVNRAEAIVEMVRQGELSNYEGFEHLANLMAEALIARNQIQDRHVLA